jgi:hypothetical protein
MLHGTKPQVNCSDERNHCSGSPACLDADTSARGSYARPYALSLTEEVYGSTLFVMTPPKRDAALVRARELGGQGP